MILAHTPPKHSFEELDNSSEYSTTLNTYKLLVDILDTYKIQYQLKITKVCKDAAIYLTMT
jgi:hypothetical protein